MTTRPNTAATQPDPTNDRSSGWYGLVREPVPGAVILPVVCSPSLGIVTTQRYAEQFVIGRAVVADLASGKDEWNRLGIAVGLANEMTDELDALSSDSLLVLIDCLFDLAVAAGREWLTEIGDSHALHEAWWTCPQQSAPHRTARDLQEDIEDAWLSPAQNDNSREWSRAIEVAGSCTVDTLSAIVESLADAVVKIAIAALQVRPGYTLSALSQSKALYEPPVDVIFA